MQFHMKTLYPKNTLAGILVTILTILHFVRLPSYTYGEEQPYPSYSLALENPDGLDDEFMLFQKTKYVRIASKKEEDINKEPSIVTVITAKEIENMGARTLTDILRTVPGFDIIKDAAIGFVEVGTRGAQRLSEGIKVHIVNNELYWQRRCQNSIQQHRAAKPQPEYRSQETEFRIKH